MPGKRMQHAASLMSPETMDRPSCSVFGSKLISVNKAVGFLVTRTASAFADMWSFGFSAIYAGVKLKRPSASKVCRIVRTVMSKVADPIHYGKVLKTVIEGISIEMMNMLGGGKWTSESLFHDGAMFVFPDSA